MDPQRTAQIPDTEGVQHDYMLTLFPFDQGFPLAVEVGEIIGIPIAELITGADIGSPGEEGSIQIDWTTIAQGVVKSLAKLRGAAGYDLVCRLLSRCRRSTVDPQGRHQWAELSNRAQLNAIYQGNYGEALRACSWVIRENWIPLSFGSGSIAGFLASLTGRGASDTPTPGPTGAA